MKLHIKRCFSLLFTQNRLLRATRTIIGEKGNNIREDCPDLFLIDFIQKIAALEIPKVSKIYRITQALECFHRYLNAFALVYCYSDVYRDVDEGIEFERNLNNGLFNLATKYICLLQSYKIALGSLVKLSLDVEQQSDILLPNKKIGSFIDKYFSILRVSRVGIDSGKSMRSIESKIKLLRFVNEFKPVGLVIPKVRISKILSEVGN